MWKSMLNAYSVIIIKGKFDLTWHKNTHILNIFSYNFKEKLLPKHTQRWWFLSISHIWNNETSLKKKSVCNVENCYTKHICAPTHTHVNTHAHTSGTQYFHSKSTHPPEIPAPLSQPTMLSNLSKIHVSLPQKVCKHNWIVRAFSPSGQQNLLYCTLTPRSCDFCCSRSILSFWPSWTPPSNSLAEESSNCSSIKSCFCNLVSKWRNSSWNRIKYNNKYS